MVYLVSYRREPFLVRKEFKTKKQAIEFCEEVSNKYGVTAKIDYIRMCD